MIKIAANFSPALLQLLTDKRLSIDYIKLSMDNLAQEQAAASAPFAANLFHFLPDLGAPTQVWQNFNFSQLNQMVKKYGVPHLSLHLDAYKSVLQIPQAEILPHFLKNYHFITQKIEVPLLVENVDQEPDWSPAGTYDRYPGIFLPEFISNFIEQSQAPLLLDLSHLRCCAHFLQIPAKTYLQKLPLATVKEIHTNGPRLIENEMCDVHEEMQAVDYDLLKYTLKKSQPQVITLEYGGVGEVYLPKSQPEVLCRQLISLQALAA